MEPIAESVENPADKSMSERQGALKPKSNLPHTERVKGPTLKTKEDVPTEKNSCIGVSDKVQEPVGSPSY